MNPEALRVFIYQEIIGHARWPTLGSIASHFGVDISAAREALAGMKFGKTVLVNPQTGELWMAGPFSDKETPYQVWIGRKSWWANCAWDMFGIISMVGVSGRVESRCTDCGEEMNFQVNSTHGPDIDAVVHFLVPAARWYDDIGYT